MKYEKQGFAIIVPINENYVIRANILRANDKKDNIYDFTLEISHKDYGIFQIIGDDEVYRMGSSNINRDVADYIMRIYNEGFFHPIINRYDYIVIFINFGMSS